MRGGRSTGSGGWGRPGPRRCLCGALPRRLGRGPTASAAAPPQPRRTAATAGVPSGSRPSAASLSLPALPLRPPRSGCSAAARAVLCPPEPPRPARAQPWGTCRASCASPSRCASSPTTAQSSSRWTGSVLARTAPSSCSPARPTRWRWRLSPPRCRSSEYLPAPRLPHLLRAEDRGPRDSGSLSPAPLTLRGPRGPGRVGGRGQLLLPLIPSSALLWSFLYSHFPPPIADRDVKTATGSQGLGEMFSFLVNCSSLLSSHPRGPLGIYGGTDRRISPRGLPPAIPVLSSPVLATCRLRGWRREKSWGMRCQGWGGYWGFLRGAPYSSKRPYGAEDPGLEKRPQSEGCVLCFSFLCLVFFFFCRVICSSWCWCLVCFFCDLWRGLSLPCYHSLTHAIDP